MWAARVILVLASLPFTLSAIIKILHLPAAVQGFGQMGISPGVLLPLGILELSCVALYLIPRTAVLGTFLLTGYLGGAVLANIIIHHDFIHALVTGLLVWTGAYLRVPELRRLIPIRKDLHRI